MTRALVFLSFRLSWVLFAFLYYLLSSSHGKANVKELLTFLLNCVLAFILSRQWRHSVVSSSNSFKKNFLTSRVVVVVVIVVVVFDSREKYGRIATLASWLKYKRAYNYTNVLTDVILIFDMNNGNSIRWPFLKLRDMQWRAEWARRYETSYTLASDLITFTVEPRYNEPLYNEVSSV